MDRDERFLIVEDELLIAEHISNILAKAGYRHIVIAINVKEAIAAIQQQRPDLVITDIALGSSSTGIDLGKALREEYKIPFIYLTSHSSQDIVAKARHTYPEAYLVKPFKKEDLLVAVELALFNASEENKTGNDFLLIKDGHSLVQIPHSEILWLQAEGNYTAIHSPGSKKRLVRMLITEIHQQLPADVFLRVHKSYVANRRYVTELQSAHILLGVVKLPVGRTYRESLAARIR